MNKIGLDEKFALFNEYWRPKTIAALNGQEVKLVKAHGEFRGTIMNTRMNSFWSGAAASASNFATV